MIEPFSIFSLQRVRALGRPPPRNIVTENRERFAQIAALFEGLVPDLVGIHAWRYQRQISSGIQEFVEALSFDHYVRTQTLVSKDEVSKSVPKGIMVTDEDYVLGLGDLTGELMRFAITFSAIGGAVNRPGAHNEMGPGKGVEGPGQGLSILSDMQLIRALFEAVSIPPGDSLSKDFSKKVEVMQSSVEKVERVVADMSLRGNERPQNWVPDVNASEVESY